MTRDLNAGIAGSGSSIQGVGKTARGYWWRVQALLRRVWGGDFPRPRTLPALWLVGTAALGMTTAVCFFLGLNSGAVSFVYLIVIVLLVLLGDSFVSSAIFSVSAVGCIVFFFAEPIFSFRVENSRDVLTFIAFLFTSLVITGLVKHLRNLAVTHREQTGLLDLTHDAVFVRSLEGVIAYWNRGAEELYGWGSDEAIGKVKHELLRTKFPAPLDEIMRLLLATGHWEGELHHTRRDGTHVSVASRWSLQKDREGRPSGILEINSDTTERKQTEGALRKLQAAYFAEAQRLSMTGSFGWNVMSGEIFWSEETYQIFEYDPAVKPSIASVMDRVHPDDVALVRNTIEQAATGRYDVDLEHRLLMPNGGVKTVHLRARPLAEEVSGKLDGTGDVQFVGAVMDVTARAKAYAALQMTEQRYRYLFDNMPMALMQLRTRGRVRRGRIAEQLRSEGITDFSAYLERHPEYVRDALEGLTIEAVNARAVQMFGARDANELIAMQNARIWRERPDTFRRILESRLNRERTYHEETRIVTLDGRTIDVLFTIARPEHVDSDAGLVLYGFIDTTNSARTREKLQELQAELAHAARLSVLGELAASIAHEVNHPIGAMAMNGEAGLRWLDRGEPNIAEASDAMRRIVADARRAGGIVARIRDVALRRSPQQISLALNEVIGEALQCVRYELQSKQIRVLLDLAPGLPPVLADKIQLQQVIVNLIINGAQAMATVDDRPRQLVIRSRQNEAGQLLVSVQDSGVGINPEYANRLFEAFFTTKSDGMGMGLSICRTIVEGYGGRIWASNNSGPGATFQFSLPSIIRDDRYEKPPSLPPIE
jgi:PAS domain S-box-containing protein